MRTKRLMTMVVMAALVAGCASTAPRPEAPAEGSKEAPELVRITGSRIPQPAERDKRIPSTIYPMYVVDRDELWNTGATSVGGALNHLPFVDIHR